MQRTRAIQYETIDYLLLAVAHPPVSAASSRPRAVHMHMNTTTEWRQLKACSEGADSTKSRSVEAASWTNAGVVATAAVDPPPRGRCQVLSPLRGCASDRQRAASTQRFAGISCASSSPAPPPQCRVSEGPAPHEPATCADLGGACTVGGWYQAYECQFRLFFVWHFTARRLPDERVFVCPFVSFPCRVFVCVS